MSRISVSGMIAILVMSLASCGGSEDKSPLASPTPSTPSSGRIAEDSMRPENDGENAQAGTDASTDSPPILGGGTGIGSANLPSPSGLNPSFEGNFLDVNSFPLNLILSGGPPKDGIPALTNPAFAADATYLFDEDLVLGVVINGVARAYPHNIGWWHEIVNDEIGGEFISVTFCLSDVN